MENETGMKTKDKILFSAINLFSDKGYANTTMRKIAEVVGIKASSLYKHYKSKEDILSSIYAFFKEKFSEASSFSQNGLEQLEHMSSLELLNSSFYYFKHIMWTPYIIKIARIITMEQNKNQSAKNFFIQDFIEKPTQQIQEMFKQILKKESISGLDTRVLAEEYIAYIMFLYFKHNFLLNSPDIEDIEKKMAQHNEFYANNILKRGKQG